MFDKLHVAKKSYRYNRLHINLSYNMCNKLHVKKSCL
jgi:hypothetical protein